MKLVMEFLKESTRRVSFWSSLRHLGPATCNGVTPFKPLVRLILGCERRVVSNSGLSS